MTTETPLRVLGRVRLSRLTDESTSVERQKETITRWAQANGYTITGWAIDTDLSRSVDPLTAPELGKWLTDPEKIGEWDAMAVWRLDRLGSGAPMMVKMFDWCDQHNKTLYSATEGFDLSSELGRLIAMILGWVAKNELDTVRERTRDSRQALRTLGRWAGGQPPYWLRAVKTDDGWKLVIDPETAPIMRRIIDDFMSGKTVSSICFELNEEGVPTPRNWHRVRSQRAAEAAGQKYTGKPPDGRPWHGPTMWRMLERKALLGFVEHNEKVVRDENGQPIQNAEAFLTQAEYDLIKAEISRRQEGKFQRTRNAGPLLGVAVCGVCGRNLHHLTQHQKNTHKYYTFRCKHSLQIRAGDLETITAQAITGIVLGGFEVHRREFIPAEDHTAELEAAVRGLEELSETVGTLTSKTAKATLQGQMRALDARIAELEALPARPARTELRSTGITYAEEWKRLDDEGKRELLLNTGIKVEATRSKDEGVRVEINIPDDLRERMGLPTDQPYGPDSLPGMTLLRERARRGDPGLSLGSE